MTASVTNFDRDLQFVDVSAEAQYSVIPSALSHPCPVLPAAILAHGSIKRVEMTNITLGSNQIAVSGIAVRGDSMRRVLRARGTIIGPANAVVGLYYGHSDTVGGDLLATCPIETSRGSVNYLNFDATICAEASANTALDGFRYHVLFVKAENRGAQEQLGSFAFQMSVQDLAVAPPEYAAARR